MTAGTRRAHGALALTLTALVPAALAAPAGAAGPGAPNPDRLTNVATAQPKQRGRIVPNKLSRELAEIPQASGADLLEGATPGVAPAFYGSDSFDEGELPLIAIPPSTTEAQKTEPDKNTCLVVGAKKGADPSYDYGPHFLFQGQ